MPRCFVTCGMAYCTHKVFDCAVVWSVYIPSQNKCWLCPCRKNHLCVHMLFLRTHVYMCIGADAKSFLKAALIPPSPLSPSTTLCNRWEFAGEIMFFEPHTHSICQKKQRKSAIRFDSCTDHLISPLFSHHRHSFSTKSHEICSKCLSTFLCLSLRVTFIKMRLLSLWALHSSCCHNEFLCQSL